MSARRLSYDDADKIRDLHKDGKSISSIARDLKVNPTTVSRIVNNEGYMRPKQYDRKAE